MVRLGHVNIVTDDLERTIEFYRKALDLHPGRALTRPHSDQHVWLYDAAGYASIHLHLCRDCLAEAVGKRRGVHHIAFNCDDAGQLERRLKLAKIPFTKIRAKAVDVEQFNLRDPNGVHIELTFGHENLRSPQRT